MPTATLKMDILLMINKTPRKKYQKPKQKALRCKDKISGFPNPALIFTVFLDKIHIKSLECN